MSEFPDDLIPLPTMPYEQRPTNLPLDVEECRTAIWQCRGNISMAAQLLKTSASRLRTFVKKSPRLMEEVDEARQQLVDMSEDIAYEALTDGEDANRRDQMARFIMSNIGKDRGYGSGNGSAVNINLPKGNFTVQWADGSSLSMDQDNNNGDNAKVIDHE